MFNWAKAKSNNIRGRRSVVSGLRITMLCLVLLLAVSFFVSVFYIVKKERRAAAVREAESSLNLLSNSISSDLTRYSELSRLVMVDDGVVKYLRTPAESVDSALRTATRYSISEILNVTTLVDSVFLFRNDDKWMTSSRDKYELVEVRMAEEDWSENVLEARGGAVYSINADGAIYRVNGSPLISIGRIVYDIRTQRKLGTMFMNLSATFVDRCLAAVSSGDYVVVGDDGTYIAGDKSLAGYVITREFDDTVSYTDLSEGKGEFILAGRTVQGAPLIVACGLRPGAGFVMFETIWVLFILILLVIVAIVFAGTYITGNITNPISELTDAMESNRERGKLERIDMDLPANEIGVLKDTYNSMVERINVLFQKNLENEQVIRRAEMRVLHEQIKPHFLYNSLETIGYMAMDDGAPEVHSALETLGSFYRNFLSKGDREIPLEREVSIVKDYLSLQKLRYGDIIDDAYDIAPETAGCIIPKLILQPIVENSIYHGIRLKGEKGLIKISSYMDGDDLHLIVHDTGVGMSKEQIEAALKEGGEYLSKPPELSESFGLWGTIERIRYYCGRGDVVRIRSEEGEYTEVEFIIPRKESRS